MSLAQDDPLTGEELGRLEALHDLGEGLDGLAALLLEVLPALLEGLLPEGGELGGVLGGGDLHDRDQGRWQGDLP